MEGYLKKDADANKVEIFQTVPKNARYADDYKRIVTKYRVLAAVGDEAILEVELVTGRTHQIRVHMASLGTPVIGDRQYGKQALDKRLPVVPARQMLHAWRLTLWHPVESRQMTFTAPIPTDMSVYGDL